MKTPRIGGVVLVLSFFGHCPALLSRQSGSPASDLVSSDWERRADAYAGIKDNQEALRNPDVRKSLVDLLDRENQVVHQTLVESNGNTGPAVKYGEEYGEYYAQLLNTVDEVADWHDQHQICILAAGAYNPISRFASRLIAKGGVQIVGCLLKTAQSEYDFDRQRSIPVLMQLSSVNKDLPPTVREEIGRATVAGLRDPSVLVRHVTIQGASKFGTPELIPILEDLARTDPYSEPINDGKNRRYELRELATQAVQSIHDRATAK
jgi:hypothetical protein